MHIKLDITKDTIDIIQAVATIVQSCLSTIAILVGGIWVYRIFVLTRERYPKAEFDHQIIVKSITKSKILLTVIVTVTNNGKVLLRLRDGEIWILRVLPLPEEIMSAIDQNKDILEFARSQIENQDGDESWMNEIAFPLIGLAQWQDAQREVEPGNQVRQRFDFIIDSNIESIRVFSYFRNVSKPYYWFRKGKQKEKSMRKPLGINHAIPLLKIFKSEYPVYWLWTTDHDLQVSSQVHENTLFSIFSEINNFTEWLRKQGNQI